MQSQTSKERVKLAASCVVWTCDLVDTSAEGAGTREDGGRPGDDGEAEDEESVWMRTICGRLMHIARAFATQIYECHEVRIHGSLTSLLARASVIQPVALRPSASSAPHFLSSKCTHSSASCRCPCWRHRLSRLNIS